MSEARINRISNEKGDGGPSLSGITTFSGLNYFVPPKGTTAERPSDCPPGSIRFNTDSAHLEYWDGLQWLEFEATNDELGISNNAAGTSGGLGYRGIFGGGYTTGNINEQQYITISTLGNALDFGDLSSARRDVGSCSSSTRCLFAGGTPSTTTIDFVVFSSTGSNATFGTYTARRAGSGCSNATRGLFAGGNPGSSPNRTNLIEYVTLASTGNAQDFGDLNDSVGTSGGDQACASTVRGIFGLGTIGPVARNNNISYLTISTTGDALDFGDLTREVVGMTAMSNSTRGVFAGGSTADSTPVFATNTIEFITIATTGNAQDFGDLVAIRRQAGGFASPTRGIVGGGADPSRIANIDYFEIATTGNAQDFGDLVSGTGVEQNYGSSNGHGGL
jgi:hypothetical protein